MIDAFYGLIDSSSPDWFVFFLDFLFLCFSLGNQRKTIESTQPKPKETNGNRRKPKEIKGYQRIPEEK